MGFLDTSIPMYICTRRGAAETIITPCENLIRLTLKFPKLSTMPSYGAVDYIVFALSFTLALNLNLLVTSKSLRKSSLKALEAEEVTCIIE